VSGASHITQPTDSIGTPVWQLLWRARPGLWRPYRWAAAFVSWFFRLSRSARRCWGRSIWPLRVLGTAALLIAGQTGLAGQEAQAAPNRSVEMRKAEVASEAMARRMRQRLERMSAEIAALKQRPRSVRQRYLLQRKRAEADALARALTRAEETLAAQRSPTLENSSQRAVVPTPEESVTDGPVELAAKADILLDQAERIAKQAALLETRAQRLDRRTALRRGIRRLESDPFMGLEASKRSLVISRREGREETSAQENSGNSVGTSGDDASEGAGGPTVTGQSDVRSSSDDGDQAIQDEAPDESPTEGASFDDSSADRVPNSGSAGSPPTVEPSVPEDSGSDVSLGFRTLLDQQTLEEVERLEQLGTPTGRSNALKKAADALRLRARALTERAERMQDRAQPQTQGTR